MAEIRALVDIPTEQTEPEAADLLYGARAGIPFKIRYDNFSEFLNPAVSSHRLLREIEITKGVDTPVATINEAIPAAFKTIQLIYDEFEGSVAANVLAMRHGANAEIGPFISTASYGLQSVFGRDNTAFAGLSVLQEHRLTFSISNTAAQNRGFGNGTFQGFNRSSALVKGIVSTGGVNETADNIFAAFSSRETTLGNYNGIQLFSIGGNIVNLRLKIYGVL